MLRQPEPVQQSARAGPSSVLRCASTSHLLSRVPRFGEAISLTYGVWLSPVRRSSPAPSYGTCCRVADQSYDRLSAYSQRPRITENNGTRSTGHTTKEVSSDAGYWWP